MNKKNTIAFLAAIAAVTGVSIYALKKSVVNEKRADQMSNLIFKIKDKIDDLTYSLENHIFGDDTSSIEGEYAPEAPEDGINLDDLDNDEGETLEEVIKKEEKEILQDANIEDESVNKGGIDYLDDDEE